MRRVYLRSPIASDELAFLSAVRRSQDIHHPWVAAPGTPAAYRKYIESMSVPAYHAFLVCRGDNHEMVGVVNFTNIVRGLFQSGFLGYYVFAGHERQGLMQEGLQAVISEAFKKLKLHRLEANIQPGNTSSIDLVAACGFSKGGYSPCYLKITGRWRDHERWAILARRSKNAL